METKEFWERVHKSVNQCETSNENEAKTGIMFFIQDMNELIDEWDSE